MDVWALGVLAFELLTGHTALRVHEGKEQVGASFSQNVSTAGMLPSFTIPVARSPVVYVSG